MVNKEKIELAATTYADKRCSVWANDYDGFIAGVEWCKEQYNTTKMKPINLINLLLELNEFESVFLSYNNYQKNTINNAVYNARIKLLSKGLKLNSRSQSDGKIIWVSAYCG
jgi:hypothetical protein